PQFVVLVATFCSQPSTFLFPLQSRKPALQGPLQIPPEQVGAMLFGEQIIPHMPQFDALVAMFTSQPSVCSLPLQSANPVLQGPLQTPPVQVGVLLFEEQTM